MSKQDTLAGYNLAKRVEEFSTWLGNAPGWVKLDSMFDNLEEMAAVACNQVGIIIPGEESPLLTPDPVEAILAWVKEWDLNHPDE